MGGSYYLIYATSFSGYHAASGKLYEHAGSPVLEGTKASFEDTVSYFGGGFISIYLVDGNKVELVSLYAVY